MQSRGVEAFKNDLRSYTYWVSRTVSLSNSIEFCYDRLGGVRGIDPSKEPTHVQPNKELEYKLRDDITRYEAKLRYYEARIHEVDEILDTMDNDVKMAIRHVYIERQQIRKVADSMFLSHNGLLHRMNKAIERAIDETNTL